MGRAAGPFGGLRAGLRGVRCLFGMSFHAHTSPEALVSGVEKLTVRS